jgi:hypothetical protein
VEQEEQEESEEQEEQEEREEQEEQEEQEEPEEPEQQEQQEHRSTTQTVTVYIIPLTSSGERILFAYTNRVSEYTRSSPAESNRDSRWGLTVRG